MGRQKARERTSSHFCFLPIIFIAFHPSVFTSPNPDTLVFVCFFFFFLFVLGVIRQHKHITKGKMQNTVTHITKKNKELFY